MNCWQVGRLKMAKYLILFHFYLSFNYNYGGNIFAEIPWNIHPTTGEYYIFCTEHTDFPNGIKSVKPYEKAKSDDSCQIKMDKFKKANEKIEMRDKSVKKEAFLQVAAKSLEGVTTNENFFKMLYSEDKPTSLVYYLTEDNTKNCICLDQSLNFADMDFPENERNAMEKQTWFAKISPYNVMRFKGHHKKLFMSLGMKMIEKINYRKISMVYSQSHENNSSKPTTHTFTMRKTVSQNVEISENLSQEVEKEYEFEEGEEAQLEASISSNFPFIGSSLKGSLTESYKNTERDRTMKKTDIGSKRTFQDIQEYDMTQQVTISPYSIGVFHSIITTANNIYAEVTGPDYEVIYSFSHNGKEIHIPQNILLTLSKNAFFCNGTFEKSGQHNVVCKVTISGTARVAVDGKLCLSFFTLF